jgi:2-polyprenyl-6-methoxyphenol hydroxylase-like FAD-dependent oxidoreductase
MHVAVVGAGPAGLLYALLAKRRHPEWRVEVFEQNASDATYGYGVVFSDRALEFLESSEPQLLRVLTAAMETWRLQRIVHRDERIDIDGNGFSAVGRLTLLRMLQDLCREAGVSIAYQRAVTSLGDLGRPDLLVGADGANSLVRRSLESHFQPVTETLTNRFAWYGTTKVFDCLTLTFRENAHGAFVAHHYRHASSMSTFVVECDAGTWTRAGLDEKSDAESRGYCERVFAPDLEGHPLVSNKSTWRRFTLLSNREWFSGNCVLIGDALRTVHFSIGSGTRLAFEDAIALDAAFGESGEDVPAALSAFERSRRPVVEKLLAAANASSYWYEDFAQRMRDEPWRLAYDYMTRSGRMTDERLRELSPNFMAGVDKARAGGTRPSEARVIDSTIDRTR